MPVKTGKWRKIAKSECAFYLSRRVVFQKWSSRRQGRSDKGISKGDGCRHCRRERSLATRERALRNTEVSCRFHMHLLVPTSACRDAQHKERMLRIDESESVCDVKESLSTPGAKNSAKGRSDGESRGMMVGQEAPILKREEEARPGPEEDRTGGGRVLREKLDDRYAVHPSHHAPLSRAEQSVKRPKLK